jgi:hypothetical protein
MLAKVQYPESDGSTGQFDNEVSEPPPYRHVFPHPDDDREIPAVLQHKDGSWRSTELIFLQPERLHRRLTMWRGFSVRPVADQLLVRTGEMARRQVGGPIPLWVPRTGSEGHRKIIGAVARYLPALSGMRLL